MELRRKEGCPEPMQAEGRGMRLPEPPHRLQPRDSGPFNLWAAGTSEVREEGKGEEEEALPLFIHTLTHSFIHSLFLHSLVHITPFLHPFFISAPTGCQTACRMLGTMGQTQALPLVSSSQVGEADTFQELDEHPQLQPPATLKVLGEKPTDLARQAHLPAPEASPAPFLKSKSAQNC